MPSVLDSRVQRRRLQRELRHMRELLKYTQKDVADAMDWSLSKVVRIESGTVAISISDLRSLLQHYRITDADEIERLVEMARASKERPTWWSNYKEATSSQYLTFLAYENAASSIYQFEPLLIPGLLQDEDYARAILQALAGSASDKRVEEWVELRMRRQVELFDRTDPPETLFVIDEAVLHRWVGGADVMRRQLLRLKDVAARRNVTIEIVPFTAGAHPGMNGPFVILELPDGADDDVLYVENSRGDMISRDEQEEILPARAVLDQLRGLVRKEDAQTLIDRVLNSMTDRRAPPS
jgi:transcriptional regulator with XRE-family HTH domain